MTRSDSWEFDVVRFAKCHRGVTTLGIMLGIS